MNFPFTPLFLATGAVFALSLSPLRAGNVMMLDDKPAAQGKLTLAGAATIEVASPTGASPDKVDLANVLEADFPDADFHLQYFSSADSPTLPANWQAKDITPVANPGSSSYVNGELTLSGLGCQLAGINNTNDIFFFAGQPWTGNGQWTIHMKQFDPNVPSTEIGLMLRDDHKANPSDPGALDPGALMVSVGQLADGGGWWQGRGIVGQLAGWRDLSSSALGWLRMTRINSSIDADISADGRSWEWIVQDGVNLSMNTYVGVFVNSRQEKVMGKAVADQITFEPCPALMEAVPPGALLSDGSFLAGNFNMLDAKTGDFVRNGKDFPVTNGEIATVVFHPMNLQQISAASAQAGIVLKNGDFLQSDIGSLNGGGVEMFSTTLGPVDYYTDAIRACILRPVKVQPYDYEVRLADGSNLHAKSIDLDSDKVTIHTASGLDVAATVGEIAQIRAGSSRAQPLMALGWKAAASAAPVTAAPVSAASDSKAPATNAAPVDPAAPAAAANEGPMVKTWTGNNQEQMMVVPMGTPVSFPLKGRYGSVALRVAPGPNLAADAKVNLHVMADGKEIGGGLSFAGGTQPRYLKIALGQSQNVSFVADSTAARALILLIDPVGLK
jgi:hypothetical protein